ncbi:MAG: hypothetical protein ACP5IA_13665 [Sediminispirochaetaceae bacterium]
MIFVAGFYAAAARQVLVLTDPIWNELYLEDQVKKQGLSGTLLKRGYLLRTRVVPVELDKDVIEQAMGKSRAGIMLFSPAVSVVFNDLYPEGELEGWTSRRRPSSIVVFGKTSGRQESRSNSLNSGKSPFVMRLFIRADELITELDEFFDQIPLEKENFSRIYILRNRGSFVPEQVIDMSRELVRSRYPSAEVTVLTSMNEFEARPVDGNTLVLLLPGFGSDNKRVLDNLNRQGGKAIVTADSYSIAAWPDTVMGAVEFDLEGILLEALEKSEAGDRDRFFSIPFTIRK